MKFYAYVRKDLYETLAIGLGITLVASFAVYFILSNYHEHVNRFSAFLPDPDSYSFTSATGQLPFRKNPIPEDLIPILMSFNIGAAIAISTQQFWLPWLFKTWPYHLQRGLRRTTIVWAKCVAGILGFAIPAIILWTIIFLYIRRHFPIPLGWDVWTEGLLPLIWGIVFYFAATLSSILPARLYTSRFFPLPVTLFFLCWGLGTMSFVSAVICPIVVSIVWICQIIDEIQVREF